MALKDDLNKKMKEVFGVAWPAPTKGRVVPEPKDIGMGNVAVEFDKATVLYADLTGSTALVDGFKWWFAAEIYKTFLYCAARIVNAENGSITSYDGDRIMGIFIGDNQSDRAMRTALKINYAVQNIINPALKEKYATTDYTVSQVVGIDTSAIRAARTGARGDNDIVWVGPAANNAAKLTERKFQERTWITKAVYDGATDVLRLHQGAAMWTSHKWSENGDRPLYGSTWRWPV